MPFLCTCTWEEVPHLGGKEKTELLLTYPPHQRDARTKGVPQLGAGAVYPMLEEEILYDYFDIPPYWPRMFALDVGWNRSAALWGALDRDSDRLFIYSEHYQGRLTPHEHARIIKARGSWIPGVIDPASRGSSQADGEKIVELYRAEGLDLTYADNNVEAGIYDVWQRLQNNRLKICKTLINLRQEYRLYRRNPKDGHVVKPRLPQELPEGRTAAEYGDHLLDCLRYMCRGLQVMKQAPVVPKRGPGSQAEWKQPTGPLGWMA